MVQLNSWHTNEAQNYLLCGSRGIGNCGWRIFSILIGRCGCGWGRSHMTSYSWSYGGVSPTPRPYILTPATGRGQFPVPRIPDRRQREHFYIIMCTQITFLIIATRWLPVASIFTWKTRHTYYMILRRPEYWTVLRILLFDPPWQIIGGCGQVSCYGDQTYECRLFHLSGM